MKTVSSMSLLKGGWVEQEGFGPEEGEVGGGRRQTGGKGLVPIFIGIFERLICGVFSDPEAE